MLRKFTVRQTPSPDPVPTGKERRAINGLADWTYAIGFRIVIITDYLIHPVPQKCYDLNGASHQTPVIGEDGTNFRDKLALDMVSVWHCPTPPASIESFNNYRTTNSPSAISFLMY